MKIENTESAVKFFKSIGGSVHKAGKGFFYLKLRHWESGDIYASRDLVSFARNWKTNSNYFKSFSQMRAREKREVEPSKFKSMRKNSFRYGNK